MMNILFRKMKLERATLFDKFIMLPLFYICIGVLIYAEYGMYESIVTMFIMIVGIIVLFDMDNIFYMNNPKVELFVNLKEGDLKQRLWYLLFYIIIYSLSFIITTLLFPFKIIYLIRKYYKNKEGDQDATTIN